MAYSGGRPAVLFMGKLFFLWERCPFRVERMTGHSPDSVLHYKKRVEQEQYMSEPCREKPAGARLWCVWHGTRLGAAEGKTGPAKTASVLKLPPAVPVIMDRQAYPAQSAGRQARIQVVPRLIRPEYDYSGLFLFLDRYLRQSL